MPVPVELIDAYLAGGSTLRQAIHGMTPEQLRARPIPGKWSTLEVVAHLADFEPVFADRLKRAIALEKPIVFTADENHFVEKLAYDVRDLGEELALIDATRLQMGRILKALPESAFQRVAIHSEKGLVTVEQILRGAVNHITHHLPYIAEKKAALGVKS